MEQEGLGWEGSGTRERGEGKLTLQAFERPYGNLQLYKLPQIDVYRESLKGVSLQWGYNVSPKHHRP